MYKFLMQLFCNSKDFFTQYFLCSVSLHLLIGLAVSVVILKDQDASKGLHLLDQQVTFELVSTAQKLEQLKTTSDRKTTVRRAEPTLTKKADEIQEGLKNEKSLDDRVSASGPVAFDYTQELKLYLEKSKHYPRQAIRLKQSGTVEVQVKIGASGSFSEIHLSRPSKFPLLDQAALNLFKKLGRFKPLPEQIPPDSNFTIPIAYVMGQVR